MVRIGLKNKYWSAWCLLVTYKLVEPDVKLTTVEEKLVQVFIWLWFWSFLFLFYCSWLFCLFISMIDRPHLLIVWFRVLNCHTALSISLVFGSLFFFPVTLFACCAACIYQLTCATALELLSLMRWHPSIAGLSWSTPADQDFCPIATSKGTHWVIIRVYWLHLIHVYLISV